MGREKLTSGVKLAIQGGMARCQREMLGVSSMDGKEPRGEKKMDRGAWQKAKARRQEEKHREYVPRKKVRQRGWEMNNPTSRFPPCY